MKILKLKYCFIVFLVGLLAVPAFAEDPNQWRFGYYGLEGDPNTVALWHLDSNSLGDDSGHGRNINYMRPGETTWDIGKFNGGVLNSGQNDAQLAVTEQAWYPIEGIGLGEGSFTVEMWIKPDGVQPDGTMAFDFVRGDPGCQILYYGDGKLKGFVNVTNVGGIFLEGTTYVIPGVWHHVAFTRDFTTGVIKFYLDGKVEAERVPGPNDLDPNEATYWTGTYPTFKIGGNAWMGTNPFKGYMDEIRISNVVRVFAPDPNAMEGRVCGDPGTIGEADLSGPEGVPDCHIDMYDMEVVASEWLTGVPEIPGPPSFSLLGYYGQESDPEIVSLYHLDSNSLLDDSGNGRDLAMRASDWTTGKFNGGVDFPGNLDNSLSYWDEPNNIIPLGIKTADTFTIDLWWRPNGVQTWGGSLFDAFPREGVNIYYDWAEPTKLKAIVNIVGIGGVTLTSASDITPDVWHHIALTRDKASGETLLYLDGVVDASTTAGAGHDLYGSHPDYATAFKVGGNAQTGSDYVVGKVDEIRIAIVAIVGEDCTEPIADISGPEGGPDYYVDWYDFSLLASQWLDCTDPNDPSCLP